MNTSLDRTYTHRLHALAKITDRATQQAYEEDVGIPISEGRCLAAIGAFHPLSVNDLAMRANLNKAQASRSTQALVDQGMVLKQASEVDGRGVVPPPSPWRSRLPWRSLRRAATPLMLRWPQPWH